LRDYKDILKFYKKDVRTMTASNIKKEAEHLLATKLCKCIKSIKNNSSTTEKKAIAICYNTVIRKKGLKTFKFKCKSGAKFLPAKGTRKLRIIKL
jgi:hypothetical protein